jgi:hypothetical protein
MITININCEKGIHDPNWKKFRLTNVDKSSTIKDVKDKFSNFFASGYHCVGTEFKKNKYEKFLSDTTLISNLLDKD